MAPELLSMIEFLCLAVSGLLAAAVTLIAVWQTAGRNAASTHGHCGARHRASAAVPQNPFGPVHVPSPVGTRSSRRGRQSSQCAEAHDGSTLTGQDLSSVNVRVLSHPVVILQGCGRTEQCRAWLVDEALPKLTARGYEVVAA